MFALRDFSREVQRGGVLHGVFRSLDLTSYPIKIRYDVALCSAHANGLTVFLKVFAKPHKRGKVDLSMNPSAQGENLRAHITSFSCSSSDFIHTILPNEIDLHRESYGFQSKLWDAVYRAVYSVEKSYSSYASEDCNSQSDNSSFSSKILFNAQYLTLYCNICNSLVHRSQIGVTHDTLFRIGCFK